MEEKEGRKFVSAGMTAAYDDMIKKIERKMATLEKAKKTFPQHADYYSAVIELYLDEYNYAKNMAQVGREMNGETIQ
jgi:regulator of sigma D